MWTFVSCINSINSWQILLNVASLVKSLLNLDYKSLIGQLFPQIADIVIMRQGTCLNPWTILDESNDSEECNMTWCGFPVHSSKWLTSWESYTPFVSSNSPCRLSSCSPKFGPLHTDHMHQQTCEHLREFRQPVYINRTMWVSPVCAHICFGVYPAL